MTAMMSGSHQGRRLQGPSGLYALGAVAAVAIGVLAHCGAEPRDRGERTAAETPRPGEKGEEAGLAEGAGERARALPELVLPRQGGAGEHALEGMIVGSDGEPVPGAKVSAEKIWNDALRPRERSAGDAGAKRDRPAATSGSGGGFAIRGLEKGGYRLRVEGEGVLPGTVGLVELPTEPIRVLVSRRVRVAGRVVEDGKPAPGVTVALAGDAAASKRHAESDAKGTFAFEELPEGVYEVYAYDEEGVAPAESISRLGTGPFADVELSLEPAASIAGRVVDHESGAGVAALVTLTSEEGEPSRRVWSGNDGRFRVEGAWPGRWTAEPYAPGYISAASQSFEADSRYEPELRLYRGATIEGIVVGEEGAPRSGVPIAVSGKDGADRTRTYHEQRERERLAGGAAVTAGPRARRDQRFEPRGELGVVHGPIPYPPSPGSGSLHLALPDSAPAPLGEGEPAPMPPAPEFASRYVTDESGAFRVAGLEPGRYRVIAMPPGRAEAASEPFELGLGETRQGLRIELAPGVTLVGRVESVQGEPLAGARLRAAPAREGLRESRAESDDEGRFELGPLRGSVELRAQAEGYAPLSREIELGEGGGEREEVLRLARADATLAGRVRAPDGMPLADARVIVSPEGMRPVQAASDDYGRFEIRDVPRGEHSLRVVHEGYPSHTSRAQTGERAEIQVGPGGGLKGYIVDAHSSAALGAEIEASGPDEAEREVQSQEEGRFALAPIAPGAWTLRVEKEGYVPSERKVQIPASDEPGAVTKRGLTLELERGARVAGVVRDSGGARVSGAEVRVGDASTRSDGEGYFELADVPAGEVAIRARKADARGSEELSLSPGDEVVTLDLRLAAPDAPGE